MQWTSSIRAQSHFSFQLPVPPITPPTLFQDSASTSSPIYATPNFSLVLNESSDLSIPITDDQLQHDSDVFITHQRQIHNTTNSLNIHQLTHSASTTESFMPSVQIAHTRTIFMKRKHPNTTPQKLINHPSPSKLLYHRPRHTKKAAFLEENFSNTPNTMEKTQPNKHFMLLCWWTFPTSNSFKNIILLVHKPSKRNPKTEYSRRWALRLTYSPID